MDDPGIISQEVETCLRHWSVTPSSLELVSHSENIVYKVTAEDGTNYALRVHRPGYHTMAVLNSERIWTDALIQFGLRVPRAYPTKTGEYYVSAECGGTTRQIGLIAWLEGKPMSDIVVAEGEGEFPLELIRDAGVNCAQFHNQAANWTPPPEFTRHSPNIQGLLGDEPFWGRFWESPSLTRAERLTINALRKLITQRLENYGESSNTYSMIHSDMHDENLFVGDGGLMVIDFDDAGFGWHQYDLAVMLFPYSDRSDFDAIQQTLIEGYRTQRNLCDEDLSYLEMFIKMRTLALIGWLSARPELDLSLIHI